MPDAPLPGDRFRPAGRADWLTVATVHLRVTDDRSRVTRYLVTAEAGSRWSLVAVDDGWVGTPLPADPEAPVR